MSGLEHHRFTTSQFCSSAALRGSKSAGRPCCPGGAGTALCPQARLRPHSWARGCASLQPLLCCHPFSGLPSQLHYTTGMIPIGSHSESLWNPIRDKGVGVWGASLRPFRSLLYCWNLCPYLKLLSIFFFFGLTTTEMVFCPQCIMLLVSSCCCLFLRDKQLRFTVPGFTILKLTSFENPFFFLLVSLAQVHLPEKPNPSQHKSTVLLIPVTESAYIFFCRIY